MDCLLRKYNKGRKGHQDMSKCCAEPAISGKSVSMVIVTEGTVTDRIKNIFRRSISQA